MAVTRAHTTGLWQRRLYLPAYTVGDAARYAKTSPQTVAYWHYGDKAHPPILPGRARGTSLSYLELVEVAFVATFRRLGVSLVRIRKARDYLAQNFHAEYPLATRRFKTEGTHILMEVREDEGMSGIDQLVVADQSGQLAWQDLIGERFLEFEYEEGLAIRWHVAGQSAPVIIDPRIAFGAPTIAGIATWAIKGRWQAQESLSEIANDFCLTEESVRQALTFEGVELAA